MIDRSVIEIPVAVALIRNAQGAYLFGKRRSDKPYGGKWEFPGGKVEEGELVVECVVRELREELSIEVVGPRLIHTEISYYTTGKTYSLHYFAINNWSGAIENREFQEIRWLTPSEFESVDMLSGNRNICAMLLSGELD